MATPTLVPEALASDGKISAYGKARSTIKGAPLSAEELRKVDACWRASLYLSLGMLYLKDNPLLKEPLKLEDTKPRLLGHWGSDAGQSFTYTHFNRVINKYDLNAIFISGPDMELRLSCLRPTWRGHTPRSTPTRVKTWRECSASSSSSLSLAASTPETPGRSTSTADKSWRLH